MYLNIVEISFLLHKAEKSYPCFSLCLSFCLKTKAEDQCLLYAFGLSYFNFMKMSCI